MVTLFAGWFLSLVKIAVISLRAGSAIVAPCDSPLDNNLTTHGLTVLSSTIMFAWPKLSMESIWLCGLSGPIYGLQFALQKVFTHLSVHSNRRISSEKLKDDINKLLEL